MLMPVVLSHPSPFVCDIYSCLYRIHSLPISSISSISIESHFFAVAAFSQFFFSFNQYRIHLQRLKIGMVWLGKATGGMNEMSVSIITCLMDGDYLCDLEER